MPTFIFASCRGEDFESSGQNVSESYQNLIHRERDNGTLWRMNDTYRNKHAVLNEGFKCFDPGDYSVVYKVKEG